MTRLIGLGLMLLDSLATLLSLLTSSGTLLILFVSFVSSIAIAMFTGMLSYFHRPVYFQDELFEGSYREP